MTWNDRNVLVTGASGFVGSHLTERLLRQGARVRAMVHGEHFGCERYLAHCPEELRDGLEIVAGDLRDSAFVSEVHTDVDTVFHLGAVTSVAYSYKYPREAFETNAVGTANVCEAARQAGVRRMVHAASSGEYGEAYDGEPMTEEHRLAGYNPYAASKIAAFHCCESFYRSYELPVAVARFFNVYGPRMGRFLVMPAIIEQLLEGDSVRLGDIRPVRTFVYVDDIVEGVLAMAQSENAIGQVIHLGSQESVSIEQLVEKVASLMDKPVSIVRDPERFRPAQSEISCVRSDISKALRVLGWRPAVKLDEGLQRTIDWIRAGGYADTHHTQEV